MVGGGGTGVGGATAAAAKEDATAAMLAPNTIRWKRFKVCIAKPYQLKAMEIMPYQ
jgi:hypothetical protein